MAHEPQLIPDFTLVIQMAIFFASYFVMRFFIFRPYLALMAARKARTVGLMEQAAADRDQAAKLQADYEAYVKAERKKLSDWTEEERRKTNHEERRIIQAARDTAANDLQSLRVKILSDAECTRKQLLPKVYEYSSLIASKLVGHSVSVTGALDAEHGAEVEQTVQQ